MHRWSIGDVDIVRIEDLDFSVPSDRPVPDWCIPSFAPSTTEVDIAFSALAIASDGQRIVIDPWLANDFPRDEADASDHASRLLDELTGAGFAPDSVDVVVNTHLDGIGWNTVPAADGWVPAFPNARYLYPADELAAIDRGEPLYGHEALADLRAQRDVEGVDPPVSLTSAVTLVPAPGHNFGHLAVHVESGDDLAVYPGHLVLSAFQVDDPAAPDEDPNRETAIVSRRKILDELVGRRGLLLTTLVGGSGAGRVHRHDAGYMLIPEG